MNGRTLRIHVDDIDFSIQNDSCLNVIIITMTYQLCRKILEPAKPLLYCMEEKHIKGITGPIQAVTVMYVYNNLKSYVNAGSI